MVAVLVVDMLEEFFGRGINPNVPAVPNREALCARIGSLLETARSSRIPVVYVCTRHQQAETAFDAECSLCGPLCMDGHPGAEIVSELLPREQDHIVYKTRFDGFYDTALGTMLQELSVKKALICGVQTHVCVQHTAMGAFFRGIQPAIIFDCCASPRVEDHESAVEYMKHYYAAAVIESRDIRSTWERDLGAGSVSNNCCRSAGCPGATPQGDRAGN